MFRHSANAAILSIWFPIIASMSPRSRAIGSGQSCKSDSLTRGFGGFGTSLTVPEAQPISIKRTTAIKATSFHVLT